MIDVFAAEVNYPDLLVIEGKYQFKPPLPFSPGKTAAGRIAHIGSHVQGLAAGVRVVVQVEYGAFAEELCAPAVQCFPIPDGVSFAKAAALGLTYQTAWFALNDRARLERGEVVLVLGASVGIGIASIQLARALGARMVIAGGRSEADREVARAAGADHVVDLGSSNLRDELKDAVASFTDGHGADVVIDPVGGDVTAAALRALAWCGRLVIVGFASGSIPTLKANYLLLKNITVMGLQWSDYRQRTPGRVREAQREIFALYQAGQIDPYVSRTVGFDGLREALQALRRSEVQGKIILEVARE